MVVPDSSRIGERVSFLRNPYHPSLIYKLLFSLLALSSLLLPFLLASWDRTFLFPFYRISFYLTLKKTLFFFPLMVFISFAVSHISGRIGDRIGKVILILLLFILPILFCIPQTDLAQSHPDTALYFTQAKTVKLKGPFAYFDLWRNRNLLKKDKKFSLHFPLVPIIYGTIFRVFGENLMTTRIPSFIFFLFIPLLTLYLAGQFEESPPFASSFLPLVIPFFSIQNAIMHVDIPATFLYTASILFGIIAIKRGGRGRFILFLSFLILSIFTKITALLFISPPLLLYGYMERRRKGNSSLTLKWVVPLLLTILISTLLLLLIKKPVLKMGGAYIKTFISVFIQFTPIFLFLVLYAFFDGLRKGSKERIFLFISTLFPLLFIGIFCTYEHASRYLVPGIPLFSILAGSVFKGMRRGEVTFSLSMLILSSFFLLGQGYIPSLRNFQAENLRVAAHFLNSIDDDEKTLLVTSSRGGYYPPYLSISFMDIYLKRGITYGGNIFDLKTPSSGARKWWNLERVHDYYLERENKPYRFLILHIFEGGDIPEQEMRLISSCYHHLKTFSIHRTSSHLFPGRVDIYESNPSAHPSCAEMKFPISSKPPISSGEDFENIFDIR